MNFPKQKIHIPLPGLEKTPVGGSEAALGLIVVDTLRITNSKQPVTYGMHIGGGLFGISTFLITRIITNPSYIRKSFRRMKKKTIQRNIVLDVLLEILQAVIVSSNSPKMIKYHK